MTLKVIFPLLSPHSKGIHMKQFALILSLALSSSSLLANDFGPLKLDAPEVEIFSEAGTEMAGEAIDTAQAVGQKIVSRPDKTHFKTIGSVASFRWAPERYKPSPFLYDIFYYIPASVKTKKNVGALIFGHGGGGSTMDRAGSIRTVNMYMPDLKRLADELGIIVVLPSANGLNWGGHTRGLWRELVSMMRTELNVDPNRIGMSGHSMGGMGITRTYLWSADEFAFFLPMAAGMDEKHQTEQHINKVFNVPYAHLQGKNDHFDVFITRTQAQLKNTQALEKKYGLKSKLEVIFYNGSHNYDYGLFKKHLSRLITKSPRNLYQKELWGSLHTVKKTLTENNINFDYDSEPRYFWVEATQINLSEAENVSFHAKIVGQTINLTFPVLPKLSKGLRIYLHSSMLDLQKQITVKLNNKVVVVRKPLAKMTKRTDAKDPGFVFDDAIDIKL
jgi:hypothetical protein